MEPPAEVPARVVFLKRNWSNLRLRDKLKLSEATCQRLLSSISGSTNKYARAAKVLAERIKREPPPPEELSQHVFSHIGDWGMTVREVCDFLRRSGLDIMASDLAELSGVVGQEAPTPKSRPSDTNPPQYVEVPSSNVTERVFVRNDGRKITLVRSGGGRLRSPSGSLTLREYAGFDYNDLSYDARLTGAEELIRGEQELLSLFPKSITHFIEQKLADVYVDIVEIAKYGSHEPRDVQELITYLKSLRYNFARKIGILVAHRAEATTGVHVPYIPDNTLEEFLGISPLNPIITPMPLSGTDSLVYAREGRSVVLTYNKLEDSYVIEGQTARFRNYEGFDLNDLMYDHRLTPYIADVISMDKQVFHRWMEARDFASLEQDLCDAYCSVVGRAKAALPRTAAASVILKLKHMRLLYVVKLNLLASNFEPSVRPVLVARFPSLTQSANDAEHSSPGDKQHTQVADASLTKAAAFIEGPVPEAKTFGTLTEGAARAGPYQPPNRTPNIPIGEASTKKGQTGAEGKEKPLDVYEKGVRSRLDWIALLWNSRPRDALCDPLLSDLKRIFLVEAPQVYMAANFTEIVKGSNPPTVTCLHSGSNLLANTMTFLDVLGSIITLGNFTVDAGSGLLSRVKGYLKVSKEKHNRDLWEGLSIFTAVSQAVADSKVKGLVWAILTIGTAELHQYIRTSVPISLWPEKLRNCVAHSQGRIIGPVFVGYNSAHRRDTAEPEEKAQKEITNKFGCDWHIQVEIDVLMVMLLKVFSNIDKVCDTERISADWKKAIHLSKRT